MALVPAVRRERDASVMMLLRGISLYPGALSRSGVGSDGSRAIQNFRYAQETPLNRCSFNGEQRGRPPKGHLKGMSLETLRARSKSADRDSNAVR